VAVSGRRQVVRVWAVIGLLGSLVLRKGDLKADVELRRAAGVADAMGVALGSGVGAKDVKGW